MKSDSPSLVGHPDGVSFTMIAFDAMVSGEEWLCVELGGSEVYVVRLSAVYNARSPC